MASKRIVHYKCPFCDKSFIREDLINHIEDNHIDLIPSDFTVLRYVFNYVNKKPLTYHGKCTECGGSTPWDENKGRYDRQCGKKACHDSFVKKFEANMMKTRGVTRISATKEGQKKMLANRKISGKYKFQDGGIKEYCGSYELKALEFMDKVMNIKSDDIMAPGPILEYTYEGKTHIYITDFYYQPYNLIIEVKDGGDNPNKRNMPEYRGKQIAKERYIIKHTNYNYLRLTNNDLSQLMAVFADLKMQLLENTGERVIHVNESMENQTIDTFIFDLGGVLMGYGEDMGFKDMPIPEEAKESISNGIKEYFHNSRSLSDNVDFDKEVERIKAYIPNEYKQFTYQSFEFLMKYNKPFEYVNILLDEAKKAGIKLYYLSNWSKGSFMKIKETGNFDFLSKFDGGIVSYEIDTKKPNPEIYETLIEKYNIIPENALFMDDKQENLDAALKCGLNTLLFDNKVTWKKILNYIWKNYNPINELMTSLCYGPIRGIKDSDAYIIQNLQNNVFSVGVGTHLNNVIGPDENNKLNHIEIPKEDYDKLVLYKLPIDRKEVSKRLKDFIGESVSKEFVYEKLLDQKLYSFDQIKFQGLEESSLDPYKKDILAIEKYIMKDIVTIDNVLESVEKLMEENNYNG